MRTETKQKIVAEIRFFFHEDKRTTREPLLQGWRWLFVMVIWFPACFLGFVSSVFMLLETRPWAWPFLAVFFLFVFLQGCHYLARASQV